MILPDRESISVHITINSKKAMMMSLKKNALLQDVGSDVLGRLKKRKNVVSTNTEAVCSLASACTQKISMRAPQ